MIEKTVNWSKLIPLKKEEINKLNNVAGVFRISERESDGKYYVIFVGSALNIKETLLKIISEENKNIDLKNYLKHDSTEFSFRYAEIEDEGIRKAGAKQLFKHYVPKYNSKEPISSLDVKINLN